MTYNHFSCEEKYKYFFTQKIITCSSVLSMNINCCLTFYFFIKIPRIKLESVSQKIGWKYLISARFFQYNYLTIFCFASHFLHHNALNTKAIFFSCFAKLRFIFFVYSRFFFALAKLKKKKELISFIYTTIHTYTCKHNLLSFLRQFVLTGCAFCFS